MHVVLAAHRRLQMVYADAYPAVATGLNNALDARRNAGIDTLAYDPEIGIAELAIAGCPCEAPALIEQLRRIEAALAERDTIIESLWIIGGPAVVPFAEQPNPMPDSDPALVSDMLYGLADATTPLPRWPVGRTPDLDPPSAGLLAQLLQQTAASHRRGAQPAGNAAILAAAAWSATSAMMLDQQQQQDILLLSPPLLSGDQQLDDLFAVRRIACNLHGIRRSAAWFGQAGVFGDLTPVLQEVDIAPYDLSGKILMSQACYGARLNNISGEAALAPTLLRAGLTALIAPLGLAYGSPDPPPGESDLLVAAWLRRTAEPDQRIGKAFQDALADLLRESLLRGGPDADDVKTLLGFVLYGDPAVHWT